MADGCGLLLFYLVSYIIIRQHHEAMPLSTVRLGKKVGKGMWRCGGGRIAQEYSIAGMAPDAK